MSINRLIYADNAATTPLSAKAFEAMMPFLSEQYANASQPYSLAKKVRKALQESREIIAACIGANPNEIYFTSGGSESNNWIINGAVEFEMDVVTSLIEHHSILRPVSRAERLGNRVAYLPVTSTGIVPVANLENAVERPGTLVSVMLANNEIGSIQQVAELAKLTHQSQGIFHTDAVQAVGHIKIDVKSLGVDMLSASAHKFNGPKGIGFIYIREGLKWPSLIYGGSQENGSRAGTENVAAIVGMATALKENIDNLADNIIHLRELEDILLQELVINGISFKRNGDIRHIPGNVNLSFKNIEGEMLLHRLDLKGIMVSTGSACDGLETHISHVLKAIGVPENDSLGTIRISFGKQNCEADARAVALAISQIVKSADSDSIVNLSHNSISDNDLSESIFEENLDDFVVEKNADSGQLFYIRTVGCDVTGKLLDNNRIVILKGSVLRKEVTNTFKGKEIRNRIISEYCTETEEGYVCNGDLPPMSPSGSSGLAQGRSSNGKRDWKNENGEQLAGYLK